MLGRDKHHDAAMPATYLVRNTAEGREGQGHLGVLPVWDVYHGRRQVSDHGRGAEVVSNAESRSVSKHDGLVIVSFRLVLQEHTVSSHAGHDGVCSCEVSERRAGVLSHSKTVSRPDMDEEGHTGGGP